MTVSDSQLPAIVRFDVFEIDLQAGELRKEGRKVKVQEQPFRVLSLLLQRWGQIVTREELREQLWPVDTFVDFDHGLNSAVARLRDGLGDSADQPRFIETIANAGIDLSLRWTQAINQLQTPASLAPRLRIAPTAALTAGISLGLGYSPVLDWLLSVGLSSPSFIRRRSRPRRTRSRSYL
jgi:DNA-binding winged helix-turn-helix (wHTH) protein